MKKIMIRVLAFMLVLASLWLTSCESKAPESTETSADTQAETVVPSGDVLNLNELDETGKKAAFAVVRSDYISNTDAATKGAISISKALKQMLGVAVTVTTDYDDRNDNESLKEIVVGSTNRVSEKGDVTLDADCYLISVEKNKIFIFGESDGAVTEAVDYFLTVMLGYDETDPNTQTISLLTVGTVIEGQWEDPEKVPDDGNPKVLYGLSQEQADEYFGDILDGLFTGTTEETVDESTVIGSSFAMHFPDIVYVNGEYWAYYICYRTDNGHGGVGLAISSDGVNYKDYGCVIQPDEDWDCNGTYFAGVWYEESEQKFYLVYEAKGGEDTSYGTLENVALATSTDGIVWEKEGIIVHRDTLPWTSANVGTPDLYKSGDTWYVFFHGYDFETCQIGVAYGTDLHNLTIVSEPLLPTETGTDWSGTTGRRDVIYVDGWYYMVYEVSTDSPYDSAYWTHMFARSKDLINWEHVDGPLVYRTTSSGTRVSGFGYDGPCWCIIGKHIYVYFRIGSSTYRSELTAG